MKDCPVVFFTFFLYLVGLALLNSYQSMSGLKYVFIAMIIPTINAVSDGISKWLLDPKLGNLTQSELLVVRFAPTAVALLLYANRGEVGIQINNLTGTLAVSVLCGFFPLWFLYIGLAKGRLTDLATWECVIPGIAFFGTLHAHLAQHAKPLPILGALLVMSGIVFGHVGAKKHELEEMNK